VTDLLNKTIWLFLVSALIFVGCQKYLQLFTKKHAPEELAIGPNIEKLKFLSDHAFSAFQAAGGLDAWTKIKNIQLYGVVTFYQPDGSFYLTEHQFEIYPWSNSIRVTAKEPLSVFVWQLVKGQFRLLKPDTEVEISEMTVSYRDYAEAILNIVTTPVRFVDESTDFIRAPKAIKIEGLWYFPIERTYAILQVTPTNIDKKVNAAVHQYWSKVIFFQHKDSSLVDMLWFAKTDENKFLAVRGYDYKRTKGNGVLLPAKAEIFRADAQANLKERLAKIDFK